MTGLSNSATPSSVTSAGTFDNGLIATNSGSEAFASVATSSICPSISRMMAQARTLRTYGLVGEKHSFTGVISPQNLSFFARRSANVATSGARRNGFAASSSDMIEGNVGWPAARC